MKTVSEFSVCVTTYGAATWSNDAIFCFLL